MKLRQEQIEIMRARSFASRRQADDLLHALEFCSLLDPQTGELFIAADEQGFYRIRFNSEGRPASVLGLDGREHHFRCDEAGRPVSVIDAAGSEIRIRYDEEGRLAELVDQEGHRSQIVYDAGLPSVFQRPGTDAVRVDFNEEALPVEFRDGHGCVARFNYNDWGRLDRYTDRTGFETRYDYDDDGLLSALTTPHGAIWRFHFDNEQQRKIVEFPDGSIEQTEYDGTGISTFVRRDGAEIYIDSETGGLPRSITYPGHRAILIDYDSDNHVIAIDNGVHPVRFEYDEAGRRVVEEINGRRLRLDYAEEGLLQTLSSSAGPCLRLGYGEDQRINRLVTGSSQFAFDRNRKGEVVRIGFPNGTSSQRIYSPIGLLQYETLVTKGREIRRVYQYDANGSPVEISDSEFGTTTRSFDDEDRLLKVDSPLETATCRYDAHGNLIQLGDRRYQYNSLDELTDGGSARCRYDGVGNLVELDLDGEFRRFEYDGQNQLVRASLPSGEFAEYEYDGIGRRVAKNVGGTRTTYTWWGDLLIAEEVDGPDPMRVDYVYLPGTYLPLAMRLNGRLYCYHTDHLDCPVRLTNESGRVVWAAEPHGFGFKELVREVRQPLRFPGQIHDEETGLYYNIGRYYHPALGRYLTPDPMFFRDGTNRYLYAFNNPSRFIDPTGRLAPLLIIGAAMAIGALIGGAHRVASNLTQGRDWDDGLWGGDGAIVRGAAIPMVAAMAVVALPASAGAVTVGAVGLAVAAAANVGLAALQAPPGGAGEACQDAFAGMVPFLNQATHDYENDPTLRNPTGQRIVDGVFDAFGVVATLFGIRKATKTRQAHAEKKAAAAKKAKLDEIKRERRKRYEKEVERQRLEKEEKARKRREQNEKMKEIDKKYGKDSPRGAYEKNKLVDTEGSRAENKVFDSRGGPDSDNVVNASKPYKSKYTNTEIDVETKTEVIEVKSGDLKDYAKSDQPTKQADYAKSFDPPKEHVLAYNEKVYPNPDHPDLQAIRALGIKTEPHSFD